MTLITIAAARDHLELGDDVAEARLAPLIAAAEQALADFLGRPQLVGPDAGSWTTAEAVPANVVHAAKLILAELWDNRGTPVEDMVPVRNLCGRYVLQSFA